MTDYTNPPFELPRIESTPSHYRELIASIDIRLTFTQDLILTSTC